MNIGSEIVGARCKNLFGVGTGSPVAQIAGVAGKKIRVLGYVLTSQSTAAVATFGDGASTFCDLLTAAPITAPCANCGWFETASGAPLNLTFTAATAFGGHILYQLVDA